VNIASVILPDMSIEIYERFYKNQFEKERVSVSFLITPSTTNDRINRIAETSKNSFVYLVFQTSVTGGALKITNQLMDRYGEIKSICNQTPVMLGFGISSKEDVVKAQQNCDGAIVGSAYLKALKIGEVELFLEEILG